MSNAIIDNPVSVNPRFIHPEPKTPLRKAAEGFEQQFMNHVLEVMRKSVNESDLMGGSNAEKIFRSMLDYEYAGIISQNNGGIGIADMVEKQIMEQIGNTENKNKLAKK